MKTSLLAASSLLLVVFLHYTATLAQSQAPSPNSPVPPSPSPASPIGGRNVTAILEKGGQFSSLIRLLKATQMDDRINNQLKKSNQGFTIFAPSDGAFSSLQSGTLNTLTYQQQVQLAQFHVLTTYLAQSQFQTATNPLHTEAGDSSDGQFPLNITTASGQVNLTTGVVNTTLGSAVYTDGNLAVYQVDQVLLPQQIFASPSPAPSPAPTPAPAPAKHKKPKTKPVKAASPPPVPLVSVPPARSPPAASSDNPSVDASGAVALVWHSGLVWFGGAVLAALCF